MSGISDILIKDLMAGKSLYKDWARDPKYHRRVANIIEKLKTGTLGTKEKMRLKHFEHLKHASCRDIFKVGEVVDAVMLVKQAVIRRSGDKWILYTKDGKRKLGTHDSKLKAIKQEYAIEKSKMRKAAQASEPEAKKEVSTLKSLATGLVPIPILAKAQEKLTVAPPTALEKHMPTTLSPSEIDDMLKSVSLDRSNIVTPMQFKKEMLRDMKPELRAKMGTKGVKQFLKMVQGPAALVGKTGKRFATVPDYGKGIDVTTLAHELGHLKSKLMSTQGLAKAFNILGHAGLAGGNYIPAFTKDENIGLTGATAGSALQLPRIASELEASARGAKMLPKHLKLKRLLAFKGVPSYMAAAALPFGVYGIKKYLGGYNEE